MLTNRAEDRVFAALADRKRREIVRALADQPLPVHAIAAKFDVSRPAISRHLRVLKDADLVAISAAGRENVYYVRTSTLREVEDWLSVIWARRLTKLKTLVEEAPIEH